MPIYSFKVNEIAYRLSLEGEGINRAAIIGRMADYFDNPPTIEYLDPSIVGTESLGFDNLRDLPHCSAVYLVYGYESNRLTDGMLMRKSDAPQCIYIGSARSLHKRWETHHRILDFLRYHDAFVWWIECPKELLAEIERGLIADKQPILNGKIKRDASGIDTTYREDRISIEAGKMAALDITRNQFRTALWLATIMRRGNLVMVSGRQAEEELEIGKNAFSTILTCLTKLDYLRKHASGVFELNPNYAFKGSEAEHGQAIRRWNALMQPQIVYPRQRKLA